MTKRLIAMSLLAGAMISSLLSCDGIYDDPNDMPRSNFSNLNCTDYANWVYINFHNGDTATLRYDKVAPAGWDIAIHRYDVKTNDGAGFETEYESLADLENAVANGSFTMSDDSLWTPDVDDSIIIDMSHMMSGYVDRSASKINKVIGRWLDVNLSTMPPIYTPSERVYLVRLKDKSIAAIRFTSFVNPEKYNTKGYIWFDVIYPLYIKK